jgi:hypothetical protein
LARRLETTVADKGNGDETYHQRPVLGSTKSSVEAKAEAKGT